MEVLPQAPRAIAVPPSPTICKKSRRLTPLPLIYFPLPLAFHSLLVALPAVIWSVAGLVADRVELVILFMAADAPSHRDGLDSARPGHRTHVAVAVAASLARRAFLLEDEALDMTLMIEAHEIRLIVHLLPGNGLLLVPVVKQELDARLVFDGLDVLMTTDAFIEARNPGHGAAPGIGMTVQAVDPHFFHMDVMRKLDRLGDHGSQRVIAVGCLTADGPTLLEGLVRLKGAVAVAWLKGLGDDQRRVSDRNDNRHIAQTAKDSPQDMAGLQQNPPPKSESPRFAVCLAGSQENNGPTIRAAIESRNPEFTRRNPGKYLLGSPGRIGSASRSRSRVLHKTHAIAVRADLGVNRIQLATVHCVVVVRLILVGNEIDAYLAVLDALGMVLKFQGLPDRKSLSGEGFGRQSRKRSCR